MKSIKIGLVVEGKTDKKFFDNYFKKRYDLTRTMIVLPSGSGDTCKIMNERAIKNKIQDLRDKNCDEIYILIDLDSKCKKEVYACVKELRDDYVSKLNLKKEFGIKSSKNIEEVLLQKFIKAQEDINPQNNNSLQYFCTKIGV